MRLRVVLKIFIELNKNSMTATHAVPKIAHNDFTKDLDLAPDEFLALLDLAADVKRSPELYLTRLAGKSIALLFEKPSLRTRMTFELAIQQLGGFSILNDGPIGSREPLKDVARNLDRWVVRSWRELFCREPWTIWRGTPAFRWSMR